MSREDAIDNMTQILMEAAGDVSEEDARRAATLVVDRALSQQGDGGQDNGS